MNKRTAFGLAGAVLVHVLVLYFALPKKPTPPPPDPPMTMVDLGYDRRVNRLDDVSDKGTGDSCDHSSQTYNGIGILYMLQANYGVVLQVGKGSPADQAGIQVGDKVDPELFMHTLDPKHPVTFWYIRHGIKAFITIKPNKICYH